MLRWMWTQPRYFEALGSQIAHVCASAAELDLRPDYGSRPLITISATESTDERGAAAGRARRPLQSRPARRGGPRAATGSRSTSRRTVVEAIRDVVTGIRMTAGASGTSSRQLR